MGPLALGMLALGIVGVATKSPGPAVMYDSVATLGAGASLAQKGALVVPFAVQGDIDWRSRSLVTPLVHWPPGMSLIVAPLIKSGLTPVSAARIVICLAAFGFVALSALIVVRAVGARAGVLTALSIMFNPMVAEHSVQVLSEPVFALVIVGVVFFMIEGPEHPLAYGLLAAASLAVRYVGVGVVAAAVLFAGLQPAILRVRVWRAAIAGLPGALFQVVWLWYCAYVGGAPRQFHYYPGTGRAFYRGAATVSRALAPVTSVPSVKAAAIVAGVAAVAIVVMAARGMRALAVEAPTPTIDRARRAVTASFIVAGGLLLSTILGRMFADRYTLFDGRLMMPVFVVLHVGLGVALASWGSRVRPAASRLAQAALAMWMLAAARDSVDRVGPLMTEGGAYNTATLAHSPLIAWVRERAGDREIVSNSPPALYLHAGRSSHYLPLNPDSSAPAVLADSARAWRGLVVVFTSLDTGERDLPRMIAGSRLRTLATFADGLVLAP